MKILAMTDLHGQKIAIDDSSDIDLIIIAGDITNFGDYEQAKEILSEILKSKIRLIAVPGNCDRPGVSSYLEEIDANIDEKSVDIKGLTFIGLGGSNFTPANTPNEYSDDELRERLDKNIDPEKKLVLISHSPPYNSRFDLTSSGYHVGSKAVADFINKYQPYLVICGHIHEAKGEGFIGKTKLINPGPRNKVTIRIE